MASSQPEDPGPAMEDSPTPTGLPTKRKLALSPEAERVLQTETSLEPECATVAQLFADVSCTAKEIEKIMDPSKKVSKDQVNRMVCAKLQDIVDMTRGLMVEYVALEKRSASGAPGVARKVDRILDILQHNEAAAVATDMRTLTSRVSETAQDVADIKRAVFRSAEAPLSTRQPSYASVLGTSLSSRTPPVRLQIVPTADSDSASPTQVEERVRAAVNPAEEGWQVSSVRRARRGLLLQAPDQQAADRITSSRALSEAGLKVVPHMGRKPRLIVFGVSRDLTQDQVLGYIKTQNPHVAAALDKGETLSFLYKAGPRDKPSVHWVFEATPTLWRAILDHGGLAIDWRICRVEESLTVTRCFKCCQYGHPAKFCRAASPVCSHCATPGHTFKDCPKTAEPPVCPSCKVTGKVAAHDLRSSDCPTYIRARQSAAGLIDYVDPARRPT